MLVELEYPLANVFDGKIYIAGGCKESNSSNWMEVFDPKTRIWELVLSPERDYDRVDMSAGLDGRIYYMFSNEALVYKPRESKWETVGVMDHFDREWSWLSYCVVDNVLYCSSNSNGIRWYDSKRHSWISVYGLKGLHDHTCVKLADHGGKLALFWTKYVRSSGHKNKKIWCAVIVPERRNGYMWGNVEWLDSVLTVPSSFHFVCALASTV